MIFSLCLLLYYGCWRLFDWSMLTMLPLAFYCFEVVAYVLRFLDFLWMLCLPLVFLMRMMFPWLKHSHHASTLEILFLIDAIYLFCCCCCFSQWRWSVCFYWSLSLLLNDADVQSDFCWSTNLSCCPYECSFCPVADVIMLGCFCFCYQFGSCLCQSLDLIWKAVRLLWSSFMAIPGAATIIWCD